MEELARMVTNGFTAAKKDLNDGLSSLEKRLTAEIKMVDNRVSDVDARLSTIEFLLGSNRIERLEDGMRQVKTILKIK